MDDVVFVSHTWLRRAHPDNERGVKFALLDTGFWKVQLAPEFAKLKPEAEDGFGQAICVAKVRAAAESFAVDPLGTSAPGPVYATPESSPSGPTP